ncbi:beta-ketoacyl-ACP synthase II [Litorivicinus sp.]|jgi:3-oxoacyl-[acyl-carrier-protein] synthase II|nr:beta-ketoacyl-ACP synthase II [Litorivicinus sp.]MDC1240034.1 beta-ketoacyl-ACP synthase II [Litorivicinus sp.]MDC1319306.1 beta-ketoacyl-ACP synthase II [Litorivicinus sp.]|tara:strand:- start:34527 stop:35765 length:1239 start_codon:yes stop_codon:yes gene_type:complete
MSKRRVVVTGLGMLSPCGVTVEESWNAILNGRSGISHITEFDTEEYPTKFAGLVPDFDLEYYMSTKDARKMDPFIQYGMVSAIQAVEASGLMESRFDPTRVGVSIGSGIGGLSLIENTTLLLNERGPRRVSPFFVPGSIINMIAGNLAIKYGFQGPNIAITTACTTSTHCIGFAGRMIGYGDADIVVAGGSEKASTPLGIAGFSAARALSTRNDHPEEASRPWDKGRDGFVLADGSATMVLEEYEHAKARGANIIAELIGFGMSGDAHHMTAPVEDGRGARAAMTNALLDAGLNASDIDYVNAHGTSTPLGDVAESQAIEGLLGAHASKVAVSSTKSMTGHALGAAGALEACFSILALRDQVLPPTINLDQIDDGCRLDYVPNTAREATFSTVLSNSFGFGGTNGTLIFRRI